MEKFYKNNQESADTNHSATIKTQNHMQTKLT